jgi:hypothetical protein
MSDQFTELYRPPSFVTPDGRFESYDEKVLEWLNSNTEKSRNLLRSNRGWKSAEICMAIMYGDETERIPKGLSKASVKKLRRQAREAVANVANMRYNWQHRARKSENTEYQDQAEIYDKLKDDWTYTQDLYHKIEEVGYYAAGGGTGYIWLWPDYDKATGELEIVPKVLDWRQVLPFHAGVNNDLDSLYGVCVHLEISVPEAHEMFPNHIDIIQSDRNIPSNYAKNWHQTNRTYRGVFNRLTGNKSAIAQDNYPVTDIFYTWIRDNSINNTDQVMQMGDPKAHYSYTVKPDEKLFPYRRLIISTTRGIIYDGPPLYFNCHVPISPFKFENVPGEFLGISIIRDGRRLEESTNNILRSFEDAIVGRRQPPLGVSDRLPKSIREKLRVNSRQLIGKIFEYSPTLLKESIVPLLDPKFYDVSNAEIDLVKYNSETSDYLMGTADASILTKLNQMPAADTQEAFLKSLGTLATSHSRSFEQSMIRLAKIWLYFAPQVYTTERIIVKLGADGILKALDFDPNTIVPNKENYPDLTYPERLQQHIRRFSIYAAPNSLQERMSQTNKLIVMQLIKMGVEIPNETLYNTFRDDGEYKVNRDKWIKEQVEKIKLSAVLQKALAEANNAADPNNQLATQLIEKLKGQQNGEGRPPLNDQPPQLQSKTDQDGVSRSTVTTT